MRRSTKALSTRNCAAAGWRNSATTASSIRSPSPGRNFPGASNSLDALARRFQLDRYGFDLAARKGAGGHGALVDSRILAEVYLHLKGGREQTLSFDAGDAMSSDAAVLRPIELARRAPRPTPLAPLLTEEERAAHAAFIETLGAGALWLKAS
jgi:DNA polymerase-3 subunit epsilon